MRFPTRVAVVDVAAGWVRSLSLAKAGAPILDSLTWVSPRRLVVAGRYGGESEDPRRNRLFSLNVATGEASSFWGLRGTEPSAAPAVGKLAYVSFCDAPPDPRWPGVSFIREQVRLVDLHYGGAGVPVVSRAEGEDWGRALERPHLSPDARFALTADTGTDTAVTYELWRTQNGRRLLQLRVDAPASPMAWDARGRRVAFCGARSIGFGAHRFRPRVYDLTTDVVARNRGRWVGYTTQLAWSPRGDLAMDLYRRFDEEPGVWVAPRGDLDQLKRLTHGELPVWVR